MEGVEQPATSNIKFGGFGWKTYQLLTETTGLQIEMLPYQQFGVIFALKLLITKRKIFTTILDEHCHHPLQSFIVHRNIMNYELLLVR